MRDNVPFRRLSCGKVLKLAEALSLSRSVEPDDAAVAKLADLAIAFPLRAVECLEAIVKGECGRWEIYGWLKEAKKILAVGLQDARARQKAEALVHHLGSRGFLDFRELLR